MNMASSNPTPRVYLAASLFTPFERERNTHVASALSASGLEVFLPQCIVGPSTSEGIDFQAVYSECVRGLKAAQLVLALVDGADVDSGVAWELGYAAAISIPTICARTDFRRSEDRGVNIMIEFGSTEMIYATKYRLTSQELIPILVRDVNKLLSNSV